jgi:Tfp pilus assembly PilM family ATPase/Tfp pilus assembly protein PilN
LARFLALDWDYQQLHLVAATVGRGGVQIQRAAVWQEEKSPNLADAEALGKLLRERLKAAAIAPAPVLVCVGRDRLILKDVRFPRVPPSEEPALVRFQAVKELTDPPNEVVIDYAAAAESAANGEKRALALIVRRELLETYQVLCKAAGLKLLALAPRPFGTLACLQEVVGTTGLTPPPDPPGSTVAVLTLTDRWAEFCVGRGEQLLLARSLPTGNTLASEVRRNVNVFGGQSPEHPVKAVYVAGSPEHASLCERLEQLLGGVPVYLLDPFAGIDRPELPDARRGGFAGAVGLLHGWARPGKLPINFVHPKEPRPPTDPNKRRLLIGTSVAAAALIAGVVYCYTKLADRDRRLDALVMAKLSLDKQLLQIDEDAKRIKAIDDWTQADVVWLDELYDLTERFPDPNGIRLTMFVGDPLTLSAKDKHVARMSLKGITQNYENVNALMDRLGEENLYYRVDAAAVAQNTITDRIRFRQQFTTKVDLQKRPAAEYKLRIESPKADAAKGGRDRDMGNDFFDGGAP